MLRAPPVPRSAVAGLGLWCKSTRHMLLLGIEIVIHVRLAPIAGH